MYKHDWKKSEKENLYKLYYWDKSQKYKKGELVNSEKKGVVGGGGKEREAFLKKRKR
jgi:hypothetical protein